jgi:hypothetical protein
MPRPSDRAEWVRKAIDRFRVLQLDCISAASKWAQERDALVKAIRAICHEAFGAIGAITGSIEHHFFSLAGFSHPNLSGHDDLICRRRDDIVRDVLHQGEFVLLVSRRYDDRLEPVATSE